MTRSKPAAIRNGRPRSFRIDWDRELAEHDRWLRTVVYSRLRDRDAADEVMQEVALTAVRQAAPIVDASKIAPWLYRLAVRQLQLYRRKTGRQRKLVDRYTQRAESSRNVPQDVPQDPLGWLMSLERRRMIRAAVERLGSRDAEILLLKYTENWSYEQISSHLGVSHSAVESRLHRARKRLRDALTAMNVIEANS